MKLNLKSTVLPNGVRVVTAAMPRVAGVTVGLWVKVGGRNESARLSGISHFIEHLLFKGTARRSARQISEAIEGRGGYLDAYTQEELTCFYARVTADHTSEVFAVLADMVLNPKFAPRDIAREREVVAEEIAMYRDQPAQQVDEQLMAALWPKHPLGRSLTGTVKSLSAMRRSDIVAFKRDHYVAGNLVVALAGAVEHGNAVALATRWFGRMKSGESAPVARVAATWPQALFSIRRRPIDQAHLALGFRIFGRHDRCKYAMKLLSVLMGEKMSSRLFQVVREQHGLAYAINSGMQLFEETGLFSVDAGLDVERMGRAFDLIARELGRLARTAPTARELRQAKDYAIGQLRLGLEGTTSQMSWAAEQLVLHGNILQPDQVVARLEAVGRDELRQLAKAVFQPHLASCAVISPRAIARVRKDWETAAARHL